MNRRNAITGIAAFGTLAMISSDSLFETKQNSTLHFIGLGRGGTKALLNFHKKGLKGKYTCICTPKKPDFPSDINFIRFVPPVCQEGWEKRLGLSDMSQPLALPQEVKDILRGDERFILLAGLGGYTGTFMIEELTILLKKQNRNFLTICSLPFWFEGEVKNTYAEKVKVKLQGLPNFKYCDLEEMSKSYENMTMRESFEQVNEEFYSMFQKHSLS